MNPIKRPQLLSLVLIVLFSSLMTAAQSPTPPPRIEEDPNVIRVDSRLVVVPVSVIDAMGEPVQGLGAGDFRVSEENRAQTLESVSTAENVPLEIALLFDVSASTDSMFKFQQETAAKFLQDVLRPEDRATIFTVGQKPIVVQSRETAERSVAAVRTILPTKEQTAFYDSVRFAAEHLRTTSPDGRRRVIVIISDGEDTNSEGVIRAIWNAERKVTSNIQGQQLRELRVRARDNAKVMEQIRVLKALQDADTVLYAINPAGSSYQLNTMSQFGQENLQKFADDTGGTAFLPKFKPIDTPDYLENAKNARMNTETLEGIFRQLASELRAQYLIQYYSESDFPEGKFVRLNVGLNGRSDLRVRARQGYYVKN
jgi:Ca-activated chloride channel family protein